MVAFSDSNGVRKSIDSISGLSNTSSLSSLDTVPEDDEVPAEHLTRRSIVVAVDLRDKSRRAVEWTLKHLAEPGDLVYLLLVRPHNLKGQVLVHSTDGADVYHMCLEKRLEDFTAHARERYMVRCEGIVRSGCPRQVILDEVVLREACALVMASDSQSKFSMRFVRKGVSEYCFEKAGCSVILVRPDQTTKICLRRNS